MKTNMICGHIKRETPKAILIDGAWIAKSIIKERLTVVGEFNEATGEIETRTPETLIIPAFPIEVSGDSSGRAIVVTDDGRRFLKSGFQGWSELVEEGA